MEEKTPHSQDESTAASSQESIFTIEGSTNSLGAGTSSGQTDYGSYLQWLNVYSSSTMSIMAISRDMAFDLQSRVRKVVRYIRDDSLAVNLIKYKDYVITSLKRRPEREEFLCEDVILVIISILAFLYNWVADIGVTFIYFQEGDREYALATLAILVIPLIIVNVVSMYFYNDDDHECSVEPILLQQTNRCGGPVAWGLCVFMHLIQMGTVYRSIILIYVGMKSWGEERARAQRKTEVASVIAQHHHIRSDDANSLDSLDDSGGSSEPTQSDASSSSEDYHPCIDYYALYVHQEYDLAIMDLIDAFLHDGTQVILQIFLVLTPSENIAHWRKVAQIQSAAMSLVSLSWCYSEFTRAQRSSSPNRIKLNFLGMIVQFLWRLFTLIPRVFAFALFATLYGEYIVLVIVLHWLLMSLWVYHQRKAISDEVGWMTWRGLMYNCIVGYIYVFCFLNIKDQPTRLKYLFYYTVVFVENLTLLLLWYANVQDSIYALPTVMGLTGSFIVGIMFMTLYYNCVHPNDDLPNRSQTAKFL